MILICQSICETEDHFVLGNSFCVENGVFELEAREVYSGALVKKRRYWPKNVPGDSINSHFVNKYVADFNMLEAKTGEGNSFRGFL